MMCRPCARGGDFSGYLRKNWAIMKRKAKDRMQKNARQYHRECEAPATCTCAHEVFDGGKR